MKAEEQLVLRALRWAWWEQYNQSGYTMGISADQVLRALRQSRSLPEKWRNANDPVGRVYYRMKKLADASLITSPRTWNSRHTQYWLTHTVDPAAADIPRMIELATARFNQRCVATKEEIEQKAASILPGTFEVRIDVIRKPVNNPDLWDMRVQVFSPLSTFKYFLKLAEQQALAQDAESEYVSSDDV